MLSSRARLRRVLALGLRQNDGQTLAAHDGAQSSVLILPLIRRCVFSQFSARNWWYSSTFHQRLGGAVHLEQPAGAVAIDVDRRTDLSATPR